MYRLCLRITLGRKAVKEKSSKGFQTKSDAANNDRWDIKKRRQEMKLIFENVARRICFCPEKKGGCDCKGQQRKNIQLLEMRVKLDITVRITRGYVKSSILITNCKAIVTWVRCNPDSVLGLQVTWLMTAEDLLTGRDCWSSWISFNTVEPGPLLFVIICQESFYYSNVPHLRV